MARPESWGQRRAVIVYAWKQYHAGQIPFAVLARALRDFRPKT